MADPRVQFDDAIQPTPSNGGGVYTLRSREATGVGSIRASSQVRRAKQDDIGSESNNVEDRDIKTKQV